MQFVCILIFWYTTVGVYCRPIENYCVTEECTEVAALLLRNMDHNADPCNDFFQYACGNWVKKHPLQPNVPKNSQAGDHMAKVMKEWSAVLLDESKMYKGPIQLARITLQACLNTSRKANIHEPLLQFMTSHGGMPLIHDPDNMEHYNCTNPKGISALLAANYPLTFFTIDKGGPISPFFTVTTKKAYNASFATLTLKISSGLSIPRIIYWDELPEIILNAAKHLTGNVQTTGTQLNDTIELANFVYTVNGYTKYYSSRTPTTVTMKDLQDSMPYLDWNDYLSHLLPDNMHISGDIKIETTYEEFRMLRYVDSHINTLAKQSRCRILLNYIWFYTMYTVFFKLAKDLDSYKLFAAEKKLQFNPDLMKHMVCCNQLVEGHLDQAVGALYVQENFKFNDNEMSDIHDMVANIKSEMKNILQMSDWMDNQTEQEALAKAKAMKEFLVYPNMALEKHADLLEQYYANLSFTSQSTYFDILKAVGGSAVQKTFQVLVDLTAEKEWIVSPATVNCHYSPVANSITIDAGFVNPPFFYTNGPKSMNYGGIGYVVGHEIAHAFDNRGRLFDEDGDVRDWWQAESKENYLNKSQCFIEQYGSLGTGYVNITLDGQKALGENIADAGGLKMAFRAYRKYIKKLGKEEPRLPGLMHLTNNQLFFISSAQGWCGSFTKAGLQRQIDKDPHAFNNFRVGMQMTNSKHFQQVFQCKEGAKHNPDRQCRIWLR